MQSSRPIFVSAEGQDDNIGDSILRRALLEALRPAGSLHILLGKCSDGYASGLGLQDTDVVYRGRREWQVAILTKLRGTRGAYAFNSGELDPDLQQVAVMYVAKLPLLALLRLAGWKCFHVGFGIRHPAQRINRWLKPFYAFTNVTSWRDLPSRNAVSFGSVIPDWAFTQGPDVNELVAENVGHHRPYLALSYRFDRPELSPTNLRAIRAAAEEWDLEIITMAQVRRDSERAEALAATLGGRALLWPSESHRDYEAIARAHYRKARFVIGDRLHGLIVGVTEGATPFGLLSNESSKLQRTFDTIALNDIACFIPNDDGTLIVDRLRCLDRRWLETMASVERARDRVHGLAQSLQCAQPTHR